MILILKLRLKLNENTFILFCKAYEKYSYVSVMFIDDHNISYCYYHCDKYNIPIIIQCSK